MKLSSDEGRAVAFVVGLIALATAARLVTRPQAADVPAAAQIDASALEDSSEQALRAGRARAKPLATDERIDVNTASGAELDRLPGVGPGLAARIVKERERGGAFDSAPDLRAVRGIGPGLLSRLEPHLAYGIAAGLPRRTPGSSALGGESASIRAKPPRATDTAGHAGEPLDLNTATVPELDALPGVGPALAARIVAKRDSIKGFSNIEDLKKVRGIGNAMVEKLRPFFRS